MKRTILRLSAGAVAFLLGVCSVYLIWLSYRKPARLLPASGQMKTPEAIKRIAAPPTPQDEIKPAREEWEELAELGGCTFGRVYYHPDFELVTAPERDNPEAGALFSRRWIAFLRRDKDTTVPFLISQIPNKGQTNIHIDPYDMATKGELAIYCLQFILKLNWDELKEEYKVRLDTIDMEYTNPQALLRRIIRTKRGAAEMVNLWKQVSKRES